MNFFLENLIYFVATFILILLVYILIINKARKKKNIINMEQIYLLKKFNLNKTSEKTLRWITSLTNSFIIAFTSVFIFNIDKWIWKLLIGFVTLIILIYSLYEIEGRILKKKEERK